MKAKKKKVYSGLKDYINNIRIAILLISLIIIVGTIGYIVLENYPFIDALFMTVTSISTVGFEIVHPLDTIGKLFTILLIISGLGVFAYSISVISTSIIEGEFRYHFKDYRKKLEIKKMKNHIIVCGFGRNGRQAVNELIAHKQHFVIIEQDKENIKSAESESLPFIEGDATQEDILINAGIKTAKAIISTLPHDANNLFVTFTARSLNPDIRIVSRASQESTEKKLKVAGANNVVMPERVGGNHMATLVIRPDVVEFMQLLTVQVENDSLTNLEEIMYNDLPEELKNKTLNDLEIRKKSGANIIGFKTAEGEFIINPSPDTVMLAGSKLFVLGTPEQINKMKEIIHPHHHH